MAVSNFAAFLGVAVLVIVTPGPDTALTIRNSVRSGRTGGIGTAAGVAAGQAVWAVATSLGLAALLAAFQPAYNAIRVIGCGYLIFLGLQSLMVALRSARSSGAGGGGSSKRTSGARAFGQGLLSDLSNPKMAVFFLSLLPSFTQPGRGQFLAMLILGVVFSLLTLAWLVGYAVAVTRLHDFIRRRGVGRIIDGLAGLALVAVGARLLIEPTA